MTPASAAPSGLNYHDTDYVELKRRIDAVLLQGADAAQLEQRKSRVLADFEPYVSFLQAMTGFATDRVRQTLLELENDEVFFLAIGKALQQLADWANQMNTGDLRVHAHTIYTVTRLLKPAVMVETGVANGKSSAFILRAMQLNESGRLYSIDLPIHPETAPAQYNGGFIPTGYHAGWVVPTALRAHWTLRLGDARMLLPALRGELDRIDIFMHDSLHTYEHMVFELDLAASWLKPGGVILCDDIRSNHAFPERWRQRAGGAFGTFGFLRC
jgi:predicted O-methyltransferase YrrM